MYTCIYNVRKVITYARMHACMPHYSQALLHVKRRLLYVKRILHKKRGAGRAHYTEHTCKHMHTNIPGANPTAVFRTTDSLCARAPEVQVQAKRGRMQSTNAYSRKTESSADFKGQSTVWRNISWDSRFWAPRPNPVAYQVTA